YSFAFQVIHPVVSPPVNISIGSLVHGNFQAPQQTDQYLFNANAGQPVFFQPQTGSEFLNGTLIDPSGHTVFSGALDIQGLRTLTQPGQYLLQVTGGSVVGPYGFTIFDATPPAPVPITSGTTITGAINFPFQNYVYTFSANVGDRFYIVN